MPAFKREFPNASVDTSYIDSLPENGSVQQEIPITVADDIVEYVSSQSQEDGQNNDVRDGVGVGDGNEEEKLNSDGNENEGKF